MAEITQMTGKDSIGKFEPNFLATAVGSLPHTDIDQAIELIWKMTPDIPHWPQLPRTGTESSFITQYLKGLIESRVIEGLEQPRFQVDSEDWVERMTSFYELYLTAESGDQEGLDSFGFTMEGGQGFEGFCNNLEEFGVRGASLLKGQLSGPLSLGMQITDKNRRACYYDDVQRDMLVKALAMHAAWQTRRLSKYRLPVLITIDDPALYAYGASTHITLKRDRIIEDLNVIAGSIKAEGGIPGLHVCAGMDWTLAFDSDIEVLNFDAYEYMTSMLVLADQLGAYIRRGGILSWGIVPTSNNAFTESIESLEKRLEDNISELVQRGVDEDLLRRQSMITPSCGTGTLDVDLAEQVYKLLNGLALKYKKG
ncbi:MAG: methionine synthase [Desulfitobacterium hafniense]|nr:methionine synthase [Desulfitobacterium hafniense]